MKIRIGIIFTAVFLVTCFAVNIFAEEFRWARCKIELKGKKGVDWQDSWDYNVEQDKSMLGVVAKLTTIKVSKEVDLVSLTDLDKMTSHALLFFHASGHPIFSQKEKDNIKEYLARGGFIYVDDCISFSVDAPFFREIMKMVEELFPGKKFEVLPSSHPIFHSHFDLPRGVVCNQGPVSPAMGISDEKGRLMVLATAADIHCEWGMEGNKKTPDSYKMALNMIVYALSH